MVMCMYLYVSHGYGPSVMNDLVCVTYMLICDLLSENPAHCGFYKNRDKTGNCYTNV